MFAEENSSDVSVSPKGKRQQLPPIRNLHESGSKARVTVALNDKVLLFGRLRELALYRAEVLRQNGFNVITPRDMQEAIAAIESGGIGAAILSYTLSNDMVEELAERLNQKCPECPLIAISQTGQVGHKIDPDEIVVADQGPAALLDALQRTKRKRLQ